MGGENVFDIRKLKDLKINRKVDKDNRSYTSLPYQVSSCHSEEVIYVLTRRVRNL